MKKSMMAVAAGAIALTVAGQANAQTSEVTAKLTSASEIVDSMTATTNSTGVSPDVLKKAKCVAVIPGLIQGGFIVGGRHGTGVATCKLSNGTWSSPAPFSLTGASFGFQIGGQSIDLIMMIMNNQGMKTLMSGHFKVGAEVSAAAGPVGRQGSADAGNNAAILTYSRTKGAYAGAAIKGAGLQKDDKLTKELYGKDVSFNNILDGQAPTAKTPAAGKFVSSVKDAVAKAKTES